jgi:hypothetical protein
MKRILLAIGIMAVAFALVSGAGCGLSDHDDSDKGAPPLIPAAVPLMVDGDSIDGPLPDPTPDGLEITGIDSIPGLDVVEQGGQFMLVFSWDLAGGSTVNGVVVQVEGDDNYYLLGDPVVLGNLASVTFTVHPGYPEGSYPLLVALLDENGEPGTYVRIILNVAFVADLEIIDLFPHATISTAEGRVVEPLNAGGRVYFTKPVAGDTTFTLGFEDMQGIPIPGLVKIMPGKMSGSFLPTALLQPNTQYVVIGTLPGEGIEWRNAFWTEAVTPLGPAAAQSVDKAYAFIIQASNIVEPEAAKVVFGLIGQAVPPFVLFITQADPDAGLFSALATLSEDDGGVMVQDMDAPVIVMAHQSEFADPYFISTPSDLIVTASVSGFMLQLVMHDFTISGKLTEDGLTFYNGSLDLYLDAEELRELAEEALGISIPPNTLCAFIEDYAGMSVCNDQGQIMVRAEKVEGTETPSITELYDLVIDTPQGGDTVSAAAGDSVNVSGWIEINGQPHLNSGWTVQMAAEQVGAPVGSFNPGPVVNVNADGSFSAVLNIAPATLTPGEDLVIEATCRGIPAADSWIRTVVVTVEN